MTLKDKDWSDIDKATIDRIHEWMQEMTPKQNIRDYAELMHCSYPRARAQFQYKYTPLSLGEFVTLCRYYKKNPVTELTQILGNVGIIKNIDHTMEGINKQREMVETIATIMMTAPIFNDKKTKPAE